jgi:hypothetical protein
MKNLQKPITTASGINRTNLTPYLTRVYPTNASRKRAFGQLRRTYNYFVFFKDVQGFGLIANICDWVRTGEYILS